MDTKHLTRTVWVIQEWGDHEYFGILGIFTSKAAAEADLRGAGKRPIPDDAGYWMGPEPFANHYSLEPHELEGG